jgi:hypothetical protein
MNRQMNLPAIQKIMMEFEKEPELMDMKEKEDEEKTENIVNQVPG